MLLPSPSLTEWRRYCLLRCVSVGQVLTVARALVSAKGNALYPVLSSYHYYYYYYYHYYY